MKKSKERKLLNTLESILDKFKIEEYDLEKFCWKDLNSIRNIDRSWRNVCRSFKSYFDSKKDFLEDLELFDLEIRTREVEFLLEHRYGASIDKEVIMRLIYDQRNLECNDVAILIINNLNYNLV